MTYDYIPVNDDNLDLLVNPAVALAQVGDPPTAQQPPRRILVIALLGLAIVTGLLTFVPAAYLGPLKYSAWGTAVQAFGTVMAFAATTTAFAWQWITEREQSRLTAAAERRAQAARVHGWLATTRAESESEDLPPFLVVLENRSDLPIYKALVEVVDGRNPGVPELQKGLDELVSSADLVPPQSRLRLELPNFGGAMGWRPALQVAFTDGAGRHWIRHSFGPLVELERPAWVHKEIDLGWSWQGILSAADIEPL